MKTRIGIAIALATVAVTTSGCFDTLTATAVSAL